MLLIRTTILVCLVALATLLVATSAQARSKPSPRAPVVLHLKLRRVVSYANGHCDSPILTSGRYTLVSFSDRPTQACASGFLLLDDRTSKRRKINTSTCRYGPFSTLVEAFGAPWIMFFCGDGWRLYNVTTGKWDRFGCDSADCQAALQQTERFVVGARWIEFDQNLHQDCGDHIHYDCGQAQAFYNIQTHKLRHSWAKSSRTILDLDSPTLIRNVCRPLQAPTAGSLSSYGSFGFYGSFAVTSEQNSIFLERCGSKLHMPIDALDQQTSLQPHIGYFNANTHCVLWQLNGTHGTWDGQLAGVLLPSLRRFTVTLPSRIQNAVPAATFLDEFRLYVWDDQGGLWSAAFPPPGSDSSKP